LLGKDRVDADKLRELIAREYDRAGIRRNDVDTGAVIITGETSRKENARAVLAALEHFAGDFVAATAGPDLESVLAAQGAGAVAFSAETGKRVLHMDIGGGTSNLALIEDGRIIKTGCLNVGGRLLKLDETGIISYRSPVLKDLCALQEGDRPTQEQLRTVAQTLTQGLEMAAGLLPPTQLLRQLWTRECGPMWEETPENCVLSFSGGVADCIEAERHWLEYGDLGSILGQAIRHSRLCAGEYRLGSETIRATVIGAGSHSLQLSGSTVFCRDVTLPMKNRPVIRLEKGQLQAPDLPKQIQSRLMAEDEDGVLYLPGRLTEDYAGLKTLGRRITEGFGDRPILVAMEADMAKALGQAMALQVKKPVLCMDGLVLPPGSYLDVGVPVGPSLPVVVKTLILEQ
jgi:ethanolamine utilization protein EutA